MKRFKTGGICVLLAAIVGCGGPQELAEALLPVEANTLSQIVSPESADSLGMQKQKASSTVLVA
jgi:hypothetical protein